MLELTIIGNLGKDPEGRYTPDGVFVCNFSVAHNHRKTNGGEETVWVDVSAWRDLGERCHQYLAKGRQVYVRGYPEVRAFARKDGSPGAAMHLTAQTVYFLGGGKGGEPPATEETEEEEAIPF